MKSRTFLSATLTIFLLALNTNAQIQFETHTIIEEGFSFFPVDVFAIDMDGDEDIDMISASTTLNYRVFWIENDGSENFTVHPIDDMLDINSIFAADLDNDADFPLQPLQDDANLFLR